MTAGVNHASSGQRCDTADRPSPQPNVTSSTNPHDIMSSRTRGRLAGGRTSESSLRHVVQSLEHVSDQIEGPSDEDMKLAFAIGCSISQDIEAGLD